MCSAQAGMRPQGAHRQDLLVAHHSRVQRRVVPTLLSPRTPHAVTSPCSAPSPLFPIPFHRRAAVPACAPSLPHSCTPCLLCKSPTGSRTLMSAPARCRAVTSEMLPCLHAAASIASSSAPRFPAPPSDHAPAGSRVSARRQAGRRGRASVQGEGEHATTAPAREDLSSETAAPPLSSRPTCVTPPGQTPSDAAGRELETSRSAFSQPGSHAQAMQAPYTV